MCDNATFENVRVGFDFNLESRTNSVPTGKMLMALEMNKEANKLLFTELQSSSLANSNPTSSFKRRNVHIHSMKQ